MASKEEDNEYKLKKYRFVEEFEESIDPETGEPYEGVESPKVIETELYGKVELHRIAKIDWTETVVVQEYEVDGKTEEFKIKIHEEKMGELGGWIEKEKNLSHMGKCWVNPGAVVLGEAEVMEDAIIGKDVEIGDYARVGGEANVSGQLGICENARVLGKANISGGREKGKKRVAVGENAIVRGTVKGTAKVYGDANVGEFATIAGEAEVYGNSTVGGTEKHPAFITDKAKVYGRASVAGTIKGKSAAFGNVILGEGSAILEGAQLSSGTIFGEISGSVLFNCQYLFVGKGSKIINQKEGEIIHPDLSDLYHLRYRLFTGASTWTGIVHIGEKCTLKYCTTHNGFVWIGNTEADCCDFTRCRVTDSKLKYCEVEDSIVEESTLYDSYLINATVLGNANLKAVDVRHGIVPKGVSWERTDFEGVTDVKSAYRIRFKSVSKDEMGKKIINTGGEKNKYEDSKFYEYEYSGAGARRGSGKNYEEVSTTTYEKYEVGRNYREYRKANVYVYKKLPEYESGEDPPVFDRPEERDPTFSEVKSYKGRYDAWYEANTKAGKRRKSDRERQKAIKKLEEILEDRGESISRMKPSKTASLLGYAVGVLGLWLDGRGGAPYGRFGLEEKYWKKVYDACATSVNASSGTSVNISSAWDLSFITNETGVQHYFIPDFTKPKKLASFTGDMSHKFAKVNGLDAHKRMTRGYWEYCELNGGNTWARSGYTDIRSLNYLFYLIEYYDGKLTQHGDQDKFECIDTKAIDDKIDELTLEINKILYPWMYVDDPNYYYDGSFEYLSGGPYVPDELWDEYIDLINQRDQAYDDWSDLVGEKEMNKKHEEEYEKRKRDNKIEEEYRKRWNKIQEEKNLYKYQQETIRKVKSCFYYFSDKVPNGKAYAKKLCNILNDLIDKNLKDEEIDQLWAQAQETEKEWAKAIAKATNKSIDLVTAEHENKHILND